MMQFLTYEQCAELKRRGYPQGDSYFLIAKCAFGEPVMRRNDFARWDGLSEIACPTADELMEFCKPVHVHIAEEEESPAWEYRVWRDLPNYKEIYVDAPTLIESLYKFWCKLHEEEPV